jgi:predicted Zn-dependent protease
VDAYRAIFALKPSERRYRLELTDYFISLNRLDDAEAELRSAVKSQPDDWEMKRVLVTFLSDHRGVDSAEQEVRGLMAANPGKDDLYFWLADIYLKNRAVDRAVALLNEVVARDHLETPGLNARNSLARISFARGDRALAEKLVAIVLENAPSNRDALFMRAEIAFDEGRLQSTVADLRAVLRDHAHDKEALQLLAETLVRQRRIDLAIDTLSQLLDVDPLNTAARVRLAQMLNLNGDHARAMTMLALVTKTEPNYAIAWESTARIAIDAKDWPTAEAAISKLAGMDGQALTAVYLKGTLLQATGKPDEAIRQFTQVIAAAPDAPLAEYAMVALLAASKSQNRLEATSHFIETLQSDNPFISIALAQCYIDLGKIDDAAKTLDKMVAADVHRPEPYLARARLYLAQSDTTHALEVLAKGETAVPGDFQIPMLSADLLGASGRYQEAEATYEDLLSRNPEMDAAANNLAELIADYQFTDPVALDKARRAAERFQGAKNPVLLDTLGWVYYRQGNLTKSLSIMERAVAAAQVPLQVRYHYGALLAKLGRAEQAKQQLLLATQDGPDYTGRTEAKKLLSTL